MPAYRCAEQLHASLTALGASTIPRAEWELVVVDDGSPDDTGVVAAQFADRVVRVLDGPRGPAHARNLGAQDARGPALLFVDADVVVHPYVLERVLQHFDSNAGLTAVFGCYDDHPAAPGLVSQYRNLLHRYVHLESPGPATTFWAGCGAVRRDQFLAVGGFHAARFPRPQIEDIELGYRLHDRGGLLVLDPEIGGTHLKRWTLGAMLRTDLLDRAIPWMRLLLERRSALANGTLNTNRREQLLTASTGLALLSLALFVATWRTDLLLVCACALAVVVIGNLPLFAWFARVRGLGFALATVPLRLLYYVVALTGATWALGSRPFRRTPALAVMPTGEPGAVVLPSP